jgi:DNA-binding response OmpR family regulator
MSVSLDTTPEIDARYRAMLRSRSASDRVVMACEMFTVARFMVLASLAPDADEATRRVHLFTRIYGRDFDPDSTGRIVARLRQASGSHASKATPP